MNKVDINILKKLSYEDGKKLLISNGYIQATESATSENSTISDYIADINFSLFNNEIEEVHTVSFSQYLNKNDDPLNDDKSLDFVVLERWEEVYNINNNW